MCIALKKKKEESEGKKETMRLQVQVKYFLARIEGAPDAGALF